MIEKKERRPRTVQTLTRGEMLQAERSERNMKIARALASKVFTEPDDYPENLVLLEIESGVAERMFTRERLEIIRTLRLDGPCASMEELAARVGREPEEMTLDLLDLDMIGLIEIAEIGKRMRIRAPECPIIII